MCRYAEEGRHHHHLHDLLWQFCIDLTSSSVNVGCDSWNPEDGQHCSSQYFPLHKQRHGPTGLLHPQGRSLLQLQYQQLWKDSSLSLSGSWSSRISAKSTLDKLEWKTNLWSESTWGAQITGFKPRLCPSLALEKQIAGASSCCHLNNSSQEEVTRASNFLSDNNGKKSGCSFHLHQWFLLSFSGNLNHPQSVLSPEGRGTVEMSSWIPPWQLPQWEWRVCETRSFCAFLYWWDESWSSWGRKLACTSFTFIPQWIKVFYWN